MKNKTDKIPELFREQQLLNELSSNIRKQRQITELSDQEKQAMIRDNERLMSKLPPHVLTERILEKDQGEHRKNSMGWTKIRLPSVLAAAAVCLAIVGYMLTGPLQQRSALITSDTDTIRLKGADSRIYVYKQAADSSRETLQDGDTVHQGDILQLAYRSTEYEYGLIASVDGLGHVTLHYPSGIFDVPVLNTQSQQLLPYAFRLDAAPEHEQFIFMLSDSHFQINETVRWIENTQNERNLIPEESILPEGIKKMELMKLIKETQ